MAAPTTGLDPSCPWSDWTPQTLDMFCEARLCAVVQAPAETWSNLPYFLVGALILGAAFRPGPSGARGPAALGAIALTVGAGSFFFHASGTFVGEVCDLGAMFFLSTWALLANVERLRGRLAPAVHLGLYWAITAGLVAALVAFHGGGIFLFAAEVTAVVLLELVLFAQHRRGQRPPVPYGPLVGVVVCFVAAFAVWILDVTKVWCDPDNHLITGHAVWHVLNAPVFWLLFVFHRALAQPGSGDDGAQARR